MGILLFFSFIVFVISATLTLGYSLSGIEERTVSRRCLLSYEMRRKRTVRRQRIRCRHEG